MVSRSRRYRSGLVALPLLAVLTVTGCSGSDDAASGSNGSATSSAAGSSGTGSGSTSGGGASNPAPPAATSTPEVGISTAPAVRIGKVATITDGVQIAVGKVRTVTISGQAAEPGTIAGTAVAVQIKVKNGSQKPFSVGGLAVNANFKGNLPGDPTTAKPAKNLTGELAPGASASGIYVFMVPKAASASSVSVEVISDQSPTIVTFAH